MANIIIIEDDTKVLNQFRQYFKELNEDHRLRFFSNSEEFQNLYLKSSAGDIAAHPLFKAFNQAQMSWLVSADFQTTSPFAEVAAKLQINKDGKITAFDVATAKSGKAFGLPMDQIKVLKSIDELVPESFRVLWQDFRGSVKEGKVISNAFPITTSAGAWLLKISGQKRGENAVDLVLRHQPDVFLPLLETEKKIASAQAAEATKNEEEPEELKLLSTIDLLVFRTSCVKGAPTEWLTKTAEAMKLKGYGPPDFRVRFVATMHEEQTSDKGLLVHSQLDDVICLPLDRLIFLQKMELTLGLPKRSRPSFLFMQEEKLPIEISKLVSMELLSDVGFAIRNPVALAPGTISRFKIRFPALRETVVTLARSHSSVEHPEAEGQFLVYFHFFGAQHESRKRIFTYLNRSGNYKGLHTEDATKFEFSSENLFLTAREKEKKHVIVLDADPDQAESLAGLIRDGINQTEVITENSYYLFLRKYLNFVDEGDKPKAKPPATDATAAAGAAPPSPPPPIEPVNLDEIRLATNHDLYADQVEWLIGTSNSHLISTLTPFGEQDAVMGFPAAQLLQNDLSWRTLFRGSDNEHVLDETIKLVITTHKNNKRKFALADATGTFKWLQVEIEPHTVPEQLKITLAPLENTEWMKNQETKIPRLDLLVISEDLVPENVDSWLEGLKGLALKANLITANDELKVVVVGEKFSPERLLVYRHSKVSGLHSRPLNARAFLFEATSHMQAPFSKHNFDNQNWNEVKLKVHMTKEVILEGISEFGSSLISPATIQPGTVLYLHESIFENAPNQCLPARFYHSEEIQGQKGMFSCAFIYYGITDAFLKFCRAWIRDTYAAKKAKES
ncbi:MAG: hypothetical protein IT288_03835 [Bdellovibrionales bacterium]|nr:hypothetical protein [Bdellovibrionales bacterium]